MMPLPETPLSLASSFAFKLIKLASIQDNLEYLYVAYVCCRLSNHKGRTIKHNDYNNVIVKVQQPVALVRYPECAVVKGKW